MQKLFIPIALVAMLTLSGCAAAMVGGAVVGTAATATKLAVKGTVGATKLAYKGTKAAVKGTARLLSDDDKEKGPQVLSADYRNLPDPE